MKREYVKVDQWRNAFIIFKNESHSIIWGNFKYKGEIYKSLGIKNHKENYPKEQFFVIPNFLALSVLQTLLTISLEKKKKNYTSLIKEAITQFINKSIDI